MNKQTYLLIDEQRRSNVIQQIQQLPTDPKHPMEIVIQERKRTDDQNKKMWPLLHDLSQQVIWYGCKYDKTDWKEIITAMVAKANGKEVRAAPGIGGGMVMFGQRTSDMRVSEVVEVIEAIYWFGTEQGVKFSDDAKLEIEWAKRFGDKKAAA